MRRVLAYAVIVGVIAGGGAAVVDGSRSGAYAASGGARIASGEPDPVILANYAAFNSPLVPSTMLPAGLAEFGDVGQIHEAGPARYGVQPFVTVSLNGGICLYFKQANGSAVGRCDTKVQLPNDAFDGRIGTGDDALWVGLRPDGVSDVSASDGSSVPVIDNVYVTKKPVA